MVESTPSSQKSEKSAKTQSCFIQRQTADNYDLFSLIQQSKIIDMADDLRAPFKKAALKGKEKQAKKFPAICFIGVTGHGKSSTANSVCGAELFTTSAGTASLTCKFDVVITRWLNKQAKDAFIAIDTPGIGDSGNRDTKHIALVVNGLKEIGYVNCFAIVLNS